VSLPAVATLRGASSSARTVSLAVVVAALAACGSGVREGAASESSVPPPAQVSKSLAAPANSWPNPAASDYSIPPAVSATSVSLLDVEHGVALVAIAPTGSGTQSEHPSTLWLSTDLTHWHDVTPPPARQRAGAGLYVNFDDASFVNPTTGWVTTWNSWNLGVTMYGTTDGGKSWTVVAHGAHGDHAGDAEWIQLLTPTVAFDENIAATAPHMSLSMTTDGGTSWRTVYARPPQDGSSPPTGPFELPMLFTSELRGFAATAIPPAEGQVNGGVFSTLDGGVTWTAVTPPGARSTTCPADNLGAVECMFGLPSFSDATHAVLASEVVDGAIATVGFDFTTDGGSSWRLTTTVGVPIPLVPAGSYPKTYALVATPSSRTWWIVSPDGSGTATRVTSDGGQHWSVIDNSDVIGAPLAVHAFDATHALLGTDITTSEGSTAAVYVTSDGGCSWKTLLIN
jgi:photosystem II stability/assembly factor-like uncharacterized protein